MEITTMAYIGDELSGLSIGSRRSLFDAGFVNEARQPLLELRRTWTQRVPKKASARVISTAYKKDPLFPQFPFHFPFSFPFDSPL